MKITWHTPALRGVMGKWNFYPALLTAEQISKYVLPAKDIRESKELDDYLQRDLKPRVKKIVSYLRNRDTRFFNSLLLGVFNASPNWIEFNLDAVAEKLHLADMSDAKTSLGVLAFTGAEKIFAIDGQHRVEAVREAHSEFQAEIKHDQYPVIFLAHDDSPEGKIRTRRLFCDINKNAVRVSDGDKVIIDEDELPAIVTRLLYANYPKFNKGLEIAVTEKIELVSKDGTEYFTSLLAIYKVAKTLKKLSKRQSGMPENAPENVKSLHAVTLTFFDFIIKHERSLNKYFISKKTTPAKERRNNKSLAFRPIGLELLAKLYVYFSKKGNLSLLSWALENLKWESPGGVWDGTVWLNGKIRPTGKKSAVNIILYLLNELEPAKEAELRNDIRALKNDPRYELPKKVKLPTE